MRSSEICRMADCETGERLRIRRSFLDKFGFLSNQPQKCYRMPVNMDFADWMNIHDKEPYALYVDHEEAMTSTELAVHIDRTVRSLLLGLGLVRRTNRGRAASRWRSRKL